MVELSTSTNLVSGSHWPEAVIRLVVINCPVVTHVDIPAILSLTRTLFAQNHAHERFRLVVTTAVELVAKYATVIDARSRTQWLNLRPTSLEIIKGQATVDVGVISQTVEINMAHLMFAARTVTKIRVRCGLRLFKAIETQPPRTQRIHKSIALQTESRNLRMALLPALHKT